MRIPTNKSQLKKKLKEVVSRSVNPRVQIIDGSAILWTIPWSAKEVLVNDFLVNVRYYLQNLMKTLDVYLIFDHYFENSMKKETRSETSMELPGVRFITSH